MATYTSIPFVPEGALDPAAGLNQALYVIRSVMQANVINMDLTSPPGAPDDGDMHIVAATATGDWAGQENNLARYVEDGDFWDFFVADAVVRQVVNLEDGYMYYFNPVSEAWEPVNAGS